MGTTKCEGIAAMWQCKCSHFRNSVGNCRDSLLYKGSKDDKGFELEVTG
jgi:hypothetical protein